MALHRLPIRARVLTGVLVTAAIAGVAAPALADIYSRYYYVTMPIGQQPQNTGVVTKTYSNGPGDIWANSISGGYHIDAQMCSLSGLYCGGGTKVYNIPPTGYIYSLPNHYTAGPNFAINIQPSTWNLGNVIASGYSGVD